MSRRPISRSEDLQRLEADGYTLAIVGGKLVVSNVPFVNAKATVRHDGALVMALTLAGDVAQPPDDHTASFVGGIPCDRHGRELTKIINSRAKSDLGGGVVVDCTFSMMPNTNGGRYPNLYEKVTKYIAAISGHATAQDSSATARVYKPVVPDEDDGPFKYLDTASSRAGIDALNEKLKGERVAIIGLGGSGEYILDFVVKTHVEEIHPFDEDIYLTHNAFRGPGAPTLEELDAAPLKVDHFTAIYSNMRTGILPHPYAITAENVSELRDMTFVFLAIDDAPAKKPIVDALLEMGIPFIDVGMGVNEVGGKLTGVVRTTIVTPDDRDHVADHIKFIDVGFDDDYRRNIQIAELNARNASDAVIRWKKFRGIYADMTGEHTSAFSIATNHVVNERLEPLVDGEAECA
ncbi:MAG: ThiF family adenylyltransferase [Actinobacteria bacterium]|nr:ThiF family adenylyltransferase [Actinomycetota bacterium]